MTGTERDEQRNQPAGGRTVLTVIGSRPAVEGRPRPYPTQPSESDPLLDVGEVILTMLSLVEEGELDIALGVEGPRGSVIVQGRAHGVPEDLLDGVGQLLQDSLEVRFDVDWLFAGHPASLVALPQSVEIGFGSRDIRAREWIPEDTRSSSSLDRLFSALHAWPQGFVGVRIAAVRGDEFSVSVTLHSHSRPPLRCQAAVLDALPGLALVEPDRAPARFACEKDAAALALLLPVGDDDIPPGVLVSPPAMVAVQFLSSQFDSTRSGAGDVRLGWSVTESGEVCDATLTESELLRHTHILGSTGTGKSTLLASMVSQIAAQGHGALVLDPHGNLIDRILSELPDGRALDTCLVVRADDVENPVPLNPLAGETDEAVETAISDMGAMFYELFDPQHSGIVGPRFEDRLGQALRALTVLRGNKASLLDVPMMLSDSRLQSAMLARTSDPRVHAWWTNDARSAARSSEYNELVSWTNAKFERFSASPALRSILSTGADAYEPLRAMDDGRLVLVDLAKGQLGEQASRLLGYLLLNRFWTAALNRRSAKRFHVIVDEAHSVMAGALTSMLSEGRKFGLAVAVAHQYLGQLAPTTTSALAGNVATTVSFRSAGADLSAQQSNSGGLIEPKMLSQLPNFTALVLRSVGTEVVAAPHSVVVDHAPTESDVDLDHIREAEVRTRSDLKAALDGMTQLDPKDFAPVPPRVRPRPSASKRPTTSFLDEWLARREELAKRQAQDDAATRQGDDAGTESGETPDS